MNPMNPIPYYPTLFDLSNPHEWRKHFEEFGYVVIENVITKDDIEKAQDLLWDFLSTMGINRKDPRTWSNDKWPNTALKKGIVSGYGAGQSDFMWFLRSIHNVRKPFATVWECDIADLVPSFDGFSIFRPVNKTPEWKTDNSLWYHVDQNGHDKPSFECIQGQVLIIDSNENDGGFVLVPKSHLVFAEIFQRLPHLGEGQIDFIRFKPDDKDSPWYHEFQNNNLVPVKMCAPAGSLILWDSRTTHCNALHVNLLTKIHNC